MENIKTLLRQDLRDEVREVYELLDEYRDAHERAEWKQSRDKNWDAVAKNEIWDEKEKEAIKKQNQVPLNINKLSKGVQGSAAIVTDKKPEIKFFPVGSSDLYVAELCKRAHDLVWVRNEGNDEVYDFVEESKIGGLSFIEAYFDNSKGIYGRLIFEESPPEDIYFDKDSRARDFSDTPLIKAKLRTRKYIKDNYDDVTEEDMSYMAATEEDEGGKSEGLTSGNDYGVLDSEDKDTDAYQPKNIWEVEAWLLRKETEFWVMVPNEEGFTKVVFKKDRKKDAEEYAKQHEGALVWERKVQKRVLRIIVGKKLIQQYDRASMGYVDELINPYGVDRDGEPIVSIVGIKHDRTRNAYPSCPTSKALELNKDLNKARMQFIHVISHQTSAPWVEPAGMTKWEGTPGTAGSRVLVDKGAPFAPHRAEPAAVNAGMILQREQKAEKDIDDMYDMQDVVKGKLPEGQDNVAARTVLALIDMAGTMSKPYIRKLESALVRLGKVNMAIILRHWQRDQWLRLIEEDEMKTWRPEEEKGKQKQGEQPPTEDEITKKWMAALDKVCPVDDPSKGIDIMDIDVRIAAGSSMPTNRMARAGVAMEFTKAGIYDAEAALEYIDDPNKDKIAERMKKREMMEMQFGLQKKAKK